MGKKHTQWGWAYRPGKKRCSPKERCAGRTRTEPYFLCNGEQKTTTTKKHLGCCFRHYRHNPCSTQTSTRMRSHGYYLKHLLRIFFCHLISLYRSSNCWKKSFTLLPWSSLSVEVNTRVLDSSVRYSQMFGTGNTICSILRSWRTIWGE